MHFDWPSIRTVVTGGAGFLGRSVCASLRRHGCTDLFVPRRNQYDLTNQPQVSKMYKDLNPDIVIHLAADVGGIGANQRNPGRFFFNNMAMGLHLIEQARVHSIKKFVQVGTVCSYPKVSPVPFREENLWDGYPEETNAAYGVAKKALITMLHAYFQEYGLASAVVLPSNLYGPGDNFDAETSHVIPALLKKCVDATRMKSNVVNCWGSGEVSREFLYVDDAAEGIVAAAMAIEEPIPINLGTGLEISIRNLASCIAEVTGFQGEFLWDKGKPSGQPRRCLDVSRAKRLLDWESKTSLPSGLRHTFEWYQSLPNGNSVNH